jgi:inner membrane transporter RhtA
VRTPPQALLLGSICSVQFGSAFATKLFDQAGPAGTVLLRLGISALALAAIVRPTLRGHTRREIGTVITFGLVLATMNWSFYEALSRLPLGPAVTIEFTGPLVVAVLGSRRLLDAVWIALAGGGVALLAFVGDTHGVTAGGIALALTAAACWAGYIVLSKRVGASFARLDGLSIALLAGTLLVIPAGLAQGGSALLRPAVLAGGCAVALMSSLIPYSLEIVALRGLRPATFGLLMCLQPAVASLAGTIVLDQPITLPLVVSLVMVVTASVGATLSGERVVAGVEEAAV